MKYTLAKKSKYDEFGAIYTDASELQLRKRPLPKKLRTLDAGFSLPRGGVLRVITKYLLPPSQMARNLMREPPLYDLLQNLGFGPYCQHIQTTIEDVLGQRFARRKGVDFAWCLNHDQRYIRIGLRSLDGKEEYARRLRMI